MRRRNLILVFTDKEINKIIQVMLAAVKTHEQDQAGQVHLGKFKAPSQSIGSTRTLTSRCGTRGVLYNTRTAQHWQQTGTFRYESRAFSSSNSLFAVAERWTEE
jgi:hypothetical protein